MSPRLRVALERLGLVALGTALETLAMPPGPVPAAVFVQDAPFLALLWHRGGVRWKRWALLYGVVRFAVGLRWLAHVHPAMVLGAAVVLALTQLAFGAAVRFLSASRVPFLPAVAVCAVLQELLQTAVQGSSGMPWPARSLATAAFPPLLGAASLLGAYGGSALVAATSAWASGLASLRHGDGGRALRLQALVASGVGLAVVGGLYAWSGAVHRAEVEARLDGPDARAARTAPLVVVQADIAQELKNERTEADAANRIFNEHLRLTVEALETLRDERAGALAVIWPETMVPWPFLDGPLAERFPGEWANQLAVLTEIRRAIPPGVTTRFLLGVSRYLVGRRGPRAEVHEHDQTDSLVFVDLAEVPAEPPDPRTRPASGRWPWELPPVHHDKVVLVPWGEYTPGGSWIPWIRDLRNEHSLIPEITPGDPEQAPFLLAPAPPERPGGANREVRAGTIVCFEIAFPARCRAWRERGATVLLNAGNYAWYGDTGMPAQVEALARLRASELAVSVVVAGNTGPSCIVDPSGAVRTRARRDGRTQFVPAWCAGPVWADPGYRTFYLRVGDAPWYVAGAILAGVAILRRVRGRRSSSHDAGPGAPAGEASPAGGTPDATSGAPVS